MLYHLYELNHAAMAPMRLMANYGSTFWQATGNPMADSPMGRSMAAGFDLFERLTRRYGKPEFGIDVVEINNKLHDVHEEIVFSKPFCNLVRFTVPGLPKTSQSKRQKILMVAPMSGHYATLLRGTVERMLEDFDIYITDWIDARMVPTSQGGFNLSDYAEYIIEMLEFLGTGVNIMAVCQPSVPVLAAVSLMARQQNENLPSSLCLMGGPIDTRCNPTAVNDLAEERGISWFEKNVIVKVPFPHAGFMRDVYPGFLQLTGFMTMNLERHVDAHKDLFWNMVKGDGDSADRHDRFYDEYLAVMDLDKAFYLQTVEEVFIKHSLARGTFTVRGEPVDPAAIKNIGLMTVEGELDDITGLGQTEAAHGLCKNIPDSKRVHFVQKGVGHYGVFNGRRFKSEIAPAITRFMQKNN
ncbi:MAG TPA: polyhydroxyalkanoate depolymerase [Rhizobiales bacterium]|nr:polyhydroxyalkanoate depolymerase [Hyphomicrobiales bacterium]